MRSHELAASAAATTPPWWQWIASACYFGALATTLGFAATFVLVVRPVASPLVRRLAGRILAGGAAALLISDYLQLAARTTRAGDAPTFAQGLLPANMWAYLRSAPTSGAWLSAGHVTTMHAVLVVVATTLLMMLRTRWGVARISPVAAVALIATALGSLVRSAPLSSAQLAADEMVNRVLVQSHIIFGTAWVGGLLFLTLIARQLRRANDVATAEPWWSVVWQRFSTMALVSAGVVLVSGLWLMWREFGDVTQLWSTGFGRVLLVKLALVTAMLIAGAYNQLRLLPQLSRMRLADATAGPSSSPTALRHLRIVGALEALLGVAVIAVVPFLTGSPRAQAGDHGAEHTASPGVLGLGVLISLAVAASFMATVRASHAVAEREFANGC